mgnify:CR=1 FL=1
MKVAFIGGRTFNTPDGIATYMYNLATELVKNGITPIVYCEGNESKTEMVNGFKVVQWKSYKSAALTKICLGIKSTLHALFKEKRVTVFHYNTWAPALLASYIPPIFGKKVVMQNHGLEWKRTKYSEKQRKLMKLMERFVAKTHKHWTLVSQEQTDFFWNEYHRKGITIPCAVRLPEVVQKSDILQRYGLCGNDYFLYMGRLVQEKNPYFLIKGYIKSGISDKKLVICGSNPQITEYEESLYQLAKDNKNIIFTGAIFGADKDIIYRNCFAFCIPSTLEGLPMSLLEAMSYRKIALASDIPSCHEALGNSGVWVPYEDSNAIADVLNKICNNYDSLKWQEESNYNRVKEKFSWENTTHLYIEFISSFAAQ